MFPKGDPARDAFENLAWACPRCNGAKHGKTSWPDPATGETCRLFNPRTDDWREHFVESPSGDITGLTAIGRATVEALEFNADTDAKENRADWYGRNPRLWPAW
jgi:hypothetical protein